MSRSPRRPIPTASLAAHQDYGLAISPLPAYNHHADRNSMTFSLETRNPYLDVRLRRGRARPEERGAAARRLHEVGASRSCSRRRAVRGRRPRTEAGLHDRRGDLAARGRARRRLRADVLVRELRSAAATSTRRSCSPLCASTAQAGTARPSCGAPTSSSAGSVSSWIPSGCRRPRRRRRRFPRLSTRSTS